MSAFNWIIVNAGCLSKGSFGRLRCQTHVASSYDGDQSGRFHDREYNLGEKMAWWPEDHPEYPNWKEGDNRKNFKLDANENNVAIECCYAQNESGEYTYYVVIKFQNLIPIEVLEIGEEAGWPKSYMR